MKNDIIYSECGSLAVVQSTQKSKWVRDNHWHKIHLHHIEIRHVKNSLWELYAMTNGRKYNDGFHCLPENQWLEHIAKDEKAQDYLKRLNNKEIPE